jgi:hypothetical protein
LEEIANIITEEYGYEDDNSFYNNNDFFLKRLIQEAELFELKQEEKRKS